MTISGACYAVIVDTVTLDVKLDTHALGFSPKRLVRFGFNGCRNNRGNGLSYRNS